LSEKTSPNNAPGTGVGDPAAGAAILQDAADITRFLDGDQESFGMLMKRYQQRAYAVALGLTGNHDDAMDAVQKAFLRIWRALPRFRRDQPFFPWLYRIVRNCALNQRRDEHRHRGDVPLDWVRQPDGRLSPLAETLAADLRERLWMGLEALPLEQREVFLLYHFQGLKYREIAELLDIPIGTVMSRLHSARLQLRKALGEEEEAAS
jgi:RNA polymerase sigma-70 factor (ECF subfamily)